MVSTLTRSGLCGASRSFGSVLAILGNALRFLAKATSITLLGLSAAAYGQEPIPLRVTNTSVVVDVVVTDQRNHHLSDLTAEEFEVWEDGVLQQVDSVQWEQSEGEVPDVEALAPPASEPGAVRLSASPAQPHLIIVLLDYATVQLVNQIYVRKAAVRYVQEKLRPSDLVAVFEVGMGLRFVQGFTNHEPTLVQALSRGNTAGSVYAADQAQLAASAEGAEDQVELLTSSIDTLAGNPNRGSGFDAMTLELLNNQMERAQAVQGTYRAQLSYSREQQGRPIIGAIRTIADGVAHIPGRKSLILVSEGFAVPLSLERALYQAVERAGRSNLAIYAIDAAGLAVKPRQVESELFDISAGRSGDRVKAYGGLSQFDHAREIGSDRKDSTLRYLASETGGLLIRHTNDMSGAFERVDRDLRSRYLVSYTPKNLDFKGEFRSLEVRVKRRKVKVRARPGYWAVPAGASVLSADEYRLLVEGTWEGETSGEPLELFFQPSFFPEEGNQYQVVLTVEIPAASLQTRKQQGREFKHLHLVGLVQDPAGRVIGSLRGPARVAAPPAVGHLRLDSRMQLSAGDYAVLLHASDPASGRSAFLRRTLRLPAVGERTALSSLVLGETVAPAGGGDDYLSVGDVRVYPTARRKFQDGDRLVYLLNVQRPGLDGRQQAALDVEVTLHHRGRRIHAFQESLETAGLAGAGLPRVPVARTLELSGLEPGRYLLRARVYDRVREQQLETQTSFAIER